MSPCAVGHVAPFIPFAQIILAQRSLISFARGRAAECSERSLVAVSIQCINGYTVAGNVDPDYEIMVINRAGRLISDLNLSACKCRFNIFFRYFDDRFVIFFILAASAHNKAKCQYQSRGYKYQSFFHLFSVSVNYYSKCLLVMDPVK